MANFNRVILLGNLTRDPDLRYTSTGTAVANFGLAVNRNYRTQDGDNREETCFIDIEAWGRQGEVISEYVSKGDPILIEGRLQLDTWQGQDGQQRSRHRIRLDNFQFLPRGGSRNDSDYQGGQRQPRNSGGPRQGNQQQYRPDNPPPQQGPDPADDAFGGDDIPF